MVKTTNIDLRQLNSLSRSEAQDAFLKCCGSTAWAKAMSAARPFATRDQLFLNADEVWWSLTEDDWLEAFGAHPKIGEQKAATPQSADAQQWSSQEQSESQKAAGETKAALANGNREYERRFGFIFIICASGKSADEILSALNDRLNNEPSTELRLAAEEQRKITRLRLAKLLEASPA